MTPQEIINAFWLGFVTAMYAAMLVMYAQNLWKYGKCPLDDFYKLISTVFGGATLLVIHINFWSGIQ